VKLKGQTWRGTFVGILVCLGSGFTGIRLVKKLATFLFGHKCNLPVCRETFAFILVIQANSFIGMEHALLNARLLWIRGIKMACGSAIIHVREVIICIGMEVVLAVVRAPCMDFLKELHQRDSAITCAKLISFCIGMAAVNLIAVSHWFPISKAILSGNSAFIYVQQPSSCIGMELAWELVIFL